MVKDEDDMTALDHAVVSKFEIVKAYLESIGEKPVSAQALAEANTAAAAAASKMLAKACSDAIQDGDIESVKALLALPEVDTEVPGENGMTPLRATFISYSPSYNFSRAVEVAKALVDAGAQVDVSNPSWGTPLDAASMFGNVDAVKLLVAAGANRFLQMNGKTALDRAREFMNAHPECARVVEYLSSNDAYADAYLASKTFKKAACFGLSVNTFMCTVLFGSKFPTTSTNEQAASSEITSSRPPKAPTLVTHRALGACGAYPNCILSKLNRHGRHHAIALKKAIAEFAGVRYKAALAWVPEHLLGQVKAR
jgi:hypothetical protein